MSPNKVRDLVQRKKTLQKKLSEFFNTASEDEPQEITMKEFERREKGIEENYPRRVSGYAVSAFYNIHTFFRILQNTPECPVYQF